MIRGRQRKAIHLPPRNIVRRLFLFSQRLQDFMKKSGANSRAEREIPKLLDARCEYNPIYQYFICTFHDRVASEPVTNNTFESTYDATTTARTVGTTCILPQKHAQSRHRPTETHGGGDTTRFSSLFMRASLQGPLHAAQIPHPIPPFTTSTTYNIPDEKNEEKKNAKITHAPLLFEISTPPVKYDYCTWRLSVPTPIKRKLRCCCECGRLIQVI